MPTEWSRFVHMRKTSCLASATIRAVSRRHKHVIVLSFLNALCDRIPLEESPHLPPVDKIDAGRTLDDAECSHHGRIRSKGYESR